MDEFDMDVSESISDDFSSSEVSEESALDELLGVSDTMEDFSDEDFDVASLEEFPDVEVYLDDTDDFTIEQLEESYPAVTDAEEGLDVSLADLELEQMLAECEEMQSEDEDPDVKSLNLVKR